MLNSFVEKNVLFCTVQYIKKIMIFSTQMDFLTPKTPKLTYYTE